MPKISHKTAEILLSISSENSEQGTIICHLVSALFSYGRFEDLGTATEYYGGDQVCFFGSLQSRLTSGVV
jgi:hypothetical protein